MFLVLREIRYRGYAIQERNITSGGAGIFTAIGGGSHVVPPNPVVLTQWGVVKRTPDGNDEEVALACSEEDAKRQIDQFLA